MVEGDMSQIIHLLKPKEYRVWCRPHDVPGDFKITNLPSKADCANYLTAFRTTMTGRKQRFRVWHTPRS